MTLHPLASNLDPGPSAMTGGKKPSSGSGHVHIEAVRDVSGTNCADGDCSEGPEYLKSEVISLSHTYPFRFLLPENISPSPCRWVYPLTFGGGLVGGDSVKASVAVGDKCACLVTSQESTKVYHCHHCKTTTQHLRFSVGDQALLCVLQDPVVCFKDADFLQSQVVELVATSNLVFLDWMLSGRSALSESWSFRRYISRVELRLHGEVILREVAEMEDTPHKTVAEGMGNFQVCGMCVILGEQVSFLSQALTDKYGQKMDIGQRPSQDLAVSVSPLSYTVQEKTVYGCYLRFMASSLTQVSQVICDITSPLVPVLGADPFHNKV